MRFQGALAFQMFRAPARRNRIASGMQHPCQNVEECCRAGEGNLGNLGALARTVEGAVGGDAAPTPDLLNFSGGPTFDGPAVFASGLLLLILLGISLERVLGLDRLVANALQEWKGKRIAERRKKAIDDRDSLERLFRDDPPG